MSTVEERNVLIVVNVIFFLGRLEMRSQSNSRKYLCNFQWNRYKSTF